jgi:hypothetical protein
MYRNLKYMTSGIIVKINNEINLQLTIKDK